MPKRGSIELRGTRYRAELMVQGHRHRRTFDTKGQAAAWIDSVAGAAAEGRLIDPARARTLFQEYATRWLSTRPGRAQATVQTTTIAVEKWLIPQWGSWHLGAIENADIRKWISDWTTPADEWDEGRPPHLRYRSPSTVRTYFGVFRLIMQQAEIDRYLPLGNPISRGMLPANGTPPRPVLSGDELKHLYDVCLQRHTFAYGLIRLAGDTGARQGELLALHRHHYSPLGRWLQIEQARKRDGSVGPTKTDQVRRIDLGQPTIDALNAHLSGHQEDLIFPGVRPSTFHRDTWVPLREDAGFPNLRFHDLRHTHISQLLAAGWPVLDVSRRVGHSNATTTLNRYGHVIPGRGRELIDLFTQAN